MIKLKIDNKQVEVEKGTSVLEAALKLGIHIPTMCYLKGYSNAPSCMVCMVKDARTGQLQPSCGYLAIDGAEIITHDEEVVEARKDALELLLSDHVGDCEAPCRIACPANMDIPKMNRLIANKQFNEALKTVKEDIALPWVLGYICSAPCENACHRKSVDNAVAICQLKKFVARADASTEKPYLPEKKESTGKKVAIVGSGPTGLAAAFHLQKEGVDCTVYDKNNKPGGSLISLEEEVLPEYVLEGEIAILQQFGILFRLNEEVRDLDQLKSNYDVVLLATGELVSGNNPFNLRLNAQSTGIEITDGMFATSKKGVFAAGSVVRLNKMAIRALAQGKAAAYFIQGHLKTGKGRAEKRQFNSRFGKIKAPEHNEYLKEAIADARYEPQDKLNGFIPDKAIIEASRCMHCDCRKPHTCKLRNLADDYGANQKTYRIEERNLIKKQNTHEKVIYEAEKCIRCGLCVSITENEKELVGLTYVGRGFDVRIGIPFNETLEKSLEKTALKVAEYCPTGAISIK